jgi:hypothetical protein
MYRSGFRRRHSSAIFDANIVNEEVLAGLIDAIFVLIDNVKFDNLKGIRTRVGGFRQVTADDLDLNAALRSSETMLAVIVDSRSLD